MLYNDGYGSRHLKHETVIGIVEALGKPFLFDSMKPNLMAHVDEVGWDIAKALAEGDGVFYGLVCLVRRMAQGTDDEQLYPFEQGQ